MTTRLSSTQEILEPTSPPGRIHSSFRIRSGIAVRNGFDADERSSGGAACFVIKPGGDR